MSKIALVFYYLYSLLFCLRYLPWRQAIHIPILILPCVKVKSLPRGSIVFKEPIRRGMFIMGVKGSLGQSNYQSIISIKNGGQLIVGHNVVMPRGTRLIINRGTMKIGANFACNGDNYFHCTTKIDIGENNMFGTQIILNTSDGHHIYENGKQKPMEGDIVLGNHVWIASHCIIGKNTRVADDCIVAQHSLLSKAYDKTGCLIGGMPAKILKENYSWNA